MNNTPQAVRLDPAGIDLSDPCLFWAENPDHDYLQCMENFGQTEPVLVADSPECPVLVAGYKRVLALKSLNRDVLALFISGMDQFSRGVFYLLSNHGQALSQGRIIRALRYFDSAGQTPDQIWRLLGVRPGSKHHGLWNIWLNLPQSWDMLLSGGNLCLECAPILEKAGHKDLDSLYPLFSSLKWSRSSSLNLLTWLNETARSNRREIHEIISDLELDHIVQTDLSPSDRIKNILKTVFQVRYPVFSRMKSDLAARLRPVNTGTVWNIEHKDEFETNDLFISTRLKNSSDLEKAAADLERIATSGALDNWPINTT